jgi:hypothetical protein
LWYYQIGLHRVCVSHTLYKPLQECVCRYPKTCLKNYPLRPMVHCNNHLKRQHYIVKKESQMNGDSYIFNKSNSIVWFQLTSKKTSFHCKKSKNSKYIFTTSKHVQNSKIVAIESLKFFEGVRSIFLLFLTHLLDNYLTPNITHSLYPTNWTLMKKHNWISTQLGSCEEVKTLKVELPINESMP